jgi:hypothetical protein
MGVDIYGVKPAVPEPLLPENATADQIKEYDILHWDWLSTTPGGYFQNNWWGWRPIQALINIFNHDLELGIPDQEIQSLGQNNGTGISSPEQCIKLAICFEEIAALMEQKNYDTLYLAAGSWETSNGNHVTQSTKALLSYKHQGIFYEPVVMEGEEFVSSHRCSVDNLKRFATFLKNCNGFIIH